MKRITWLSILLGIALGGALNAETKPTLAILPFTGGSGGEGETLALMLAYNPKIAAAFTLTAPGSDMVSALEAPEIQRFGVTDSDIIAQWGQELGADYVITGHIRKFGDRNAIVAGMVETETYRQAAGSYREYKTIEEINSLLPSMAKELIDASRRDASSLPVLAVQPLSIPEGVNAEETDILDRMLITEIISAGTYSVLPRLTATADLDTIAAVAAAVDAQYVLVRAAEKRGRNTEFTAFIADAETEASIAEGHKQYRAGPTGVKSILELSYTLTGVKSAEMPIKPPASPVFSTAYSPDGRRIVSGSADKTAYIWDAENGRLARSLTGHDGYVYAAAYSPDGRRIVSGSADRTLKIWDAETGRFVRSLTGHDGYVYAAAYSPDGRRIVSGSADRTLKIWDAETGEELITLTGHADWVRTVAYSPDGAYIVSGSEDATLKIWDAETGSLVRTLPGHADYVRAAVYSPEGRYIASGSDDGALKIWDAETGEELITLTGYTGSILSLAYTPDGGYLISGSSGGVLKVWDLETCMELLAFEGHTGWVRSVACSSDGRRIVSGSDDKTLRIWDIEDRLLIRSLPEGHE